MLVEPKLMGIIVSRSYSHSPKEAEEEGWKRRINDAINANVSRSPLLRRGDGDEWSDSVSVGRTLLAGSVQQEKMMMTVQEARHVYISRTSTYKTMVLAGAVGFFSGFQTSTAYVSSQRIPPMCKSRMMT